MGTCTSAVQQCLRAGPCRSHLEVYSASCRRGSCHDDVCAAKAQAFFSLARQHEMIRSDGHHSITHRTDSMDRKEAWELEDPGRERARNGGYAETAGIWTAGNLVKNVAMCSCS